MTQKIIIEIEQQKRNTTSSQPNYRDVTKLDFTASQPALLWVEGEKYPDKFDYRLYRGENKDTADSIQPLPVGKYELKASAFGIAYGNINCDFSQITPLKQPQTRAA